MSPFTYSCPVFNTMLLFPVADSLPPFFCFSLPVSVTLKAGPRGQQHLGSFSGFSGIPLMGSTGRRWWAEEEEARVGSHSFPALVATVLTRLCLYHFFPLAPASLMVRLMAFRISISNHGDLNNSLLIISCCCFLLCPHLCK